MEIWKKIEGYEGLYKISNKGNVKSLERECKGNKGVVYIKKEKILTPIKHKGGYFKVYLNKQGKRKSYFIHRLVAQAFLTNPNNLEQVNHKNEIKTDNRAENLEWCDRIYNCNYGTRNKRIGESNSKPVLCIETGKIYPSTREVERELGFVQGYISSACTGKYKQAYGYTWRYVQ